MYRITSRFGQHESFRTHGHTGIDFAMQKGEPIRSIKEGVVRIHDYGNVNAGKTVFVKWEDGKTAIYGHLNDFTVKNGQHVSPGDLLGHAGNTGFSTGNHLHFGLKSSDNAEFLDPSPYIDQIQGMNLKSFVQHVPAPAQVKVSFFEFMNQHLNAITDIKLHLISFLSDHVVLIFHLITGIL
jgi:hypothetical protein